MAEVQILSFQEQHWEDIWRFMQPVFRAGETYVYARDIDEAAAHQVWIDAPLRTFVAICDGEILGTYFIKANQPGLGSHVCNCGYITSETARGRGIASLMCEHSQAQARQLGFRAMQYNLVVSTNEAAVRLWQRHGFEIAGTLPGAFNHAIHGYVDAHVMFKSLVPFKD